MGTNPKQYWIGATVAFLAFFCLLTAGCCMSMFPVRLALMFGLFVLLVVAFILLAVAIITQLLFEKRN